MSTKSEVLVQSRFRHEPVTTLKEAYEAMRSGKWLLPRHPDDCSFYWYEISNNFVCVDTPFSSYPCGLQRVAEALKKNKTLWATCRVEEA